MSVSGQEANRKRFSLNFKSFNSFRNVTHVKKAFRASQEGRRRQDNPPESTKVFQTNSPRCFARTERFHTEGERIASHAVAESPKTEVRKNGGTESRQIEGTDHEEHGRYKKGTDERKKAGTDYLDTFYFCWLSEEKCLRPKD